MSMDGFARPTAIEWGSADRAYGQVKFGDDSQLIVLFYTKSVFNAAKSREMGTRQYENQQWIRLYTPGESLNIIDRPVQESDKHRFSSQWSQYLQNKTQVPEGTPIDLLFPNNPAIADNLKACGIYTIQQCANLSATALDRIGMGSQNWKNMAQTYIDNAKSGTAFLQLQARLNEKDQELKLLNRRLQQIQDQYNDLVNKISNPNIETNGIGYDSQMSRLNNNHPSQQLRPSVRIPKNMAPPAHEIDQNNIINQVTEESFPTIDVTGDSDDTDTPNINSDGWENLK